MLNTIYSFQYLLYISDVVLLMIFYPASDFFVSHFISFRTILDQTASLSIIFCFIVIAEMIVALSAVTIAALSTTEFIEYVDDSDRKIGRKFQVFGRRLRETASALLLNSSVTFFKVKVPAICVSIGTQTDFPEAVSFTSRAFDDRFRNNAPILVETYDGHLGRHVGDSQRSRKNSDDNTWRDCQSPHFHPIVQHALPS